MRRIYNDINFKILLLSLLYVIFSLRRLIKDFKFKLIVKLSFNINILT